MIRIMMMTKSTIRDGFDKVLNTETVKTRTRHIIFGGGRGKKSKPNSGCPKRHVQQAKTVCKEEKNEMEKVI